MLDRPGAVDWAAHKADPSAHHRADYLTGASVFRLVATGNVFGPSSAGVNVLDGSYNFVAMDGAGIALTTALRSIIIGYEAAQTATEIRDSIIIGPRAGRDIKPGSTQIILIGDFTGRDLDGDYDVCIGDFSGLGLVGNYNHCFGRYTGQRLVGSYNLVGGGFAGEDFAGSYAVMLGRYAGDGADGDFGIYIGDHSGEDMTGDKVITIGYNAGPSSAGNYDGEVFIDNHRTDTPLLHLDTAGHNLTINGTLAKTAGAFKIDHPLDPENKDLYHGFVEGPEYGLLYRGKVKLSNGRALISIDKACGMTPGTFKALAQNPTIYLQNLSGFCAVRPLEVQDGIFTIIAQDDDCTDEISWLVCAERKDKFVMESEHTDESGHLILERNKETAHGVG